VGNLPPEHELSQRPKEELDAALKQPLSEGWRSIYSIGNMW